MNQLQRIMWNGTVRSLPLKEQLRSASIAGCGALSVTPSDYLTWLGHSVTTRDMLAMADDAGVNITHLDPFVRWVDHWQPEIENFPTDPIAFDADDFFRFAANLRVNSFTAWGGFPAGRYELSQLTDAFGSLCHRAQREGLRCDLEFIPAFGIRDLKTAWHIVHAVGAPNSGIIFDFWHYIRGGRDDALLSSIPGEKITGVQLCDATMQLPAGLTLAYDGLNNRRAPWDGEFPINEIVDVLRRSSALNTVGLEIFSPDFDRMTADEIGSVTKTVLDRALKI
jgi:4-hydroxyphenylpyruvate dioxygenase